MEGLLKNDTNIHAGIRTTLSGPSDYENDGYCGFEIVEAREIDTIGICTRLCTPIVAVGLTFVMQGRMALSRRSATASEQKTLSIFQLILTRWILLVSGVT